MSFYDWDTDEMVTEDYYRAYEETDPNTVLCLFYWLNLWKDSDSF